MSISESPSVSPSVSLSGSESASVSPSVSLSQSESASESASASPSVSASISPSVSPSQSASVSPSASVSKSASLSVSPSVSASLSFGTPSYKSNLPLYYLAEPDEGISIPLQAPRLPVWNTAGRPASPTAGVYGYNTDTSLIEIFDGSNWVNYDSRYVNVTGDTMTGRFILRAGSATANTQPLQFQSGALLATPEAGSMEFLDGRWYITGSHKQRVIDRTGDVITASVDAVGTAETTLYTAALSAGAAKVGRIYKLHCDGVIKNYQTTDDPTFYVYRDTTQLATLTVVGGAYPANTPWHLDILETVRTTGATGTMALHVDISIGDGLGWSETSALLTNINFTLDRTITVKAKWSDNDNQTANVITIHQGFLELKN